MTKLTPNEIRGKILKLKNRYYKAYDELKMTINEIDKEKQELRQLCLHEWIFHSDPSGNNDSYYECNICGLEKR